MAYNAGSPYIHWICPEMRGQLPIAGMHIPRRLKKTVRSGLYDVRIDTAFEDVILACAETGKRRPETWINRPIIQAYCKLHTDGYAHSIECWRDGELVGGLYGMALGGAFFGESMFSRERDASKVALVHLAARLWRGGFEMLDTQFSNDHLEQFGVYEVPHKEYMVQLRKAIEQKADFHLNGIKESELVRDYLAMRGRLS